MIRTPTRRTWRRRRVPAFLPGVTGRMCDHWQHAGYWVPDLPPEGTGHTAYVTLRDLEGLAVLARLAPFFLKSGGPQADRGPRCPTWDEIRCACEQGGRWLASGGTWTPWDPDLVDLVGVVVDVDGIVAGLRARVEEMPDVS